MIAALRLRLQTIAPEFALDRIEALSATLQEETDTLTDGVEPYVLQEGFVIRTSMGRRATPRAYAHLGIERPIRGDQPPLPL